jgi:hypothetical protein
MSHFILHSGGVMKDLHGRVYSVAMIYDFYSGA